MKSLFTFLLLSSLFACTQGPGTNESISENPFIGDLNEAIPYAEVTSEHIEKYAISTLKESEIVMERIKKEKSPDFKNIFMAFDDVVNQLSKASSNCFMLYWVSPDSLSRDKGLQSYQLLDSLGTSLSADK